MMPTQVTPGRLGSFRLMRGIRSHFRECGINGCRNDGESGTFGMTLGWVLLPLNLSSIVMLEVGMPERRKERAAFCSNDRTRRRFLSK